MAGNGYGSTFLDFVLWPVRAFVETREFVSRIPSAGLSITLVGQILGSIGLSPGVASAVSILGLVTVFTEVFLKIVLRSRDPLAELGLRKRVQTFLIYFIAGIVYFMVFGPGSFAAPVTSISQFVLGLFITYVAGAIFMSTWKLFERNNANISLMITGSLTVTVGSMAALFYSLDLLVDITGNGVVRNALFTSPSNLSGNETVVSTKPGLG